jgi:uncharacterized membrane protein
MSKRWLLVPLFALIATVAPPALASADVNDFTVTNFSADYDLSRRDAQGQMDVTERIEVNFSDFNHGILRALPKSYKHRPLLLHVTQVSSDTNAPTRYSSYTSNGNKVLKIGDPSRTVTGHQEYTIRYTVRNVITFYPDHDELFWDINGDQWRQPFTAVTATVHLPDGAKLLTQQPRCYVGSFGSTSSACLLTNAFGGVTASAFSLSPQQTLSIVVGFQKGYFQPPTFWERLDDYRWLIMSLLLPVALGFVIGFSWWLKRGRDAKGRGTIVPEYEPPANLSPLEAGAILNFKITNRDITATIIDLARRGYLKIIETKKDRKLRKDTVSYQLELTNTDMSALNADEKDLLTHLFTDFSVPVLEIGSAKNKLYTTVDRLRKSVDDGLTRAGYFKQDPRKYSFKGGLVFVLFIVFIQFFGGVATKDNLWALVIGIFASGLVLALFVALLPARTAAGVAAKEQLLGLKMYMETAEKDRLEKLEGPSAPYASNAGEPVRTVELFEKLLPYAIVLGVETQWAGKFNDIYTSPPDWYSGNWTAFNAGYLAGSLNSGFASAVNTSFASPSSSGGSGFSGGGAGGGGGGGGGGGW